MPSQTLPAPVGGWNARDSLAAMPPTDAVVLENMVPQAESVKTRPGIAKHSDSLSDLVETTVTYHGSTEQLICAAGGKLINITAGGTGTNLATSLTNDRWNTCEFGGRMIFCNGADAVRDWDGTTLTTTAVYGHNRISNGTMTTDSVWTKGTGWTIAAGVASSDGTQTGDSDLTQTPTYALENGQTYVVTFTVSGYSAGNVCAVVGDQEGTDRSADGTYVETITASSGADFDIRADADFVGNIDEVYIAKTSEDFITATVHQGRVFYIEKDSQAFHYAAAGAYSGYTSLFDLSTIAGTGSDLLFMASWSRDSGAGMDDFGAFFFEDGTVVVYQGDDPGTANSWSLVGVYKIGAPLGRRAATKIGGDVVILTVDGYVPLSVALIEGQYSEQGAFSFKIDKAAKEAAQRYGSNYGWSSVHFPEGSWFLVNVPISAAESVQHVRNTITGAWCKFTGWDSVQYAVYDGNLYFGSPDGYVYKVAGSSDDGAFIPFTSVQAYHYYDSPHIQKQVSLVQTFADYAFPKYFDHKFYSNFNEITLPAVADPPEAEVSEWNVGEWNIAQWNAASPGARQARKNVTGTGFALAYVLRFKSRAQTVTWWASQIIYKTLGIV